MEIFEIILFVSVIFRYSLSDFRKQKFFHICMKKSFFKECFRKAGHACNINIEINILVNFRQFQNEIPPPTKQHVNKCRV